jgi:hypothetical protein
MKVLRQRTVGMKAGNVRRFLHRMNISSAQVFQPPSKSVLPPSLPPPLRSCDVTRSFMIFVRLSPSDECVFSLYSRSGPAQTLPSTPFPHRYLNPLQCRGPLSATVKVLPAFAILPCHLADFRWSIVNATPSAQPYSWKGCTQLAPPLWTWHGMTLHVTCDECSVPSAGKLTSGCGVFLERDHRNPHLHTLFIQDTL